MNTVEKPKDHSSDMEVGAAESRIILYDFFVLIVIITMSPLFMTAPQPFFTMDIATGEQIARTEMLCLN